MFNDESVLGCIGLRKFFRTCDDDVGKDDDGKETLYDLAWINGVFWRLTLKV